MSASGDQTIVTDDGQTSRAADPNARRFVLGPAEYGLIVIQSILWGSTFFFIAIARQQVPPLTLSLARLIPSVLLLGAVVAALGIRLPATWSAWRRMLLFSLLNNVVPFWLIIMAQREVSGGIAAIFMATAPLCALVLAPWFVTEERFTWAKLIGIVTGIVGVAIVTGAEGTAGSWRAQAMLLSAALCYSAANIFARRSFGGYHPFAIAASQTIAATVLTLPLALAIEQPWHLQNPSGAAWASMLVMGLAGSGLAPLCHFTVLHRAGPINAMLSSIVVPVTPIVLGVAFLGEHLGWRELTGGVVIALALMIIDGRLWGRVHDHFRAAEVEP